MSETTITINAQESTKWDPNQEGPRFKEFLNLKKKIMILLMKTKFQINLLQLFLNVLTLVLKLKNFLQLG